MTKMKVFLGFHFCLEHLTVFSDLSYILCLIVLNIAGVINSCLLIHIFDDVAMYDEP